MLSWIWDIRSRKRYVNHDKCFSSPCSDRSSDVVKDETIVIQKALSKDQIDEVISLSREFRRPAHVESELSNCWLF